MMSNPRKNAASGFAIDSEQIRETARRQFSLSLALVFVALGFATVLHLSRMGALIDVASDARIARSETAGPPSIKADVHYRDHSASHVKVAVATN